jgi:hypothetical protein
MLTRLQIESSGLYGFRQAAASELLGGRPSIQSIASITIEQSRLACAGGPPTQNERAFLKKDRGANTSELD